jgi:hypothetical protein
MPGIAIATKHRTISATAQPASRLAADTLRNNAVPRKRPNMNNTSERVKKLAAVFSGVPGTMSWT